MVLEVGERVLKTYHKEGSFNAGIDFTIANSNGHRFLGLVLLISVVVGAYLTLQEIDHAMGKGSLYRLLLEKRPDRNR